VERILGHTQTELLGKSLFDITCPDDHEDLREQLTPDAHEDLRKQLTPDAAPEAGAVADDKALVPVAAPGAAPGATGTAEWQSQRRSFYLKIRHRSGSRADQAHYELVHVRGVLRIPPKSYNKQKHG